MAEHPTHAEVEALTVAAHELCVEEQAARSPGWSMAKAWAFTNLRAALTPFLTPDDDGVPTPTHELDPPHDHTSRTGAAMSEVTPISETLRDFFRAEERNTRQAIAQGDLDVGFPLTLGTALDSLRQAPDDALLVWLAGTPIGNAQDWANATRTLLEFTSLLDTHGRDADLGDWL